MEGIYDYIKALALKSETVNGPKEGDYKGKDGLWRCGVCHALKQTSLDCGGETLHPFVQMPTIIRAAQVGEFVPEDYNKYHLIIIDDLGVERNTDFAQEVLWSMIEERVKNQLPMVITTNISLDEIKRRSGLTESAEKKCSCFDRALSKILEACTPIEINETNERRNKIWEKQQFVKETLGI